MTRDRQAYDLEELFDRYENRRKAVDVSEWLRSYYKEDGTYVRYGRRDSAKIRKAEEIIIEIEQAKNNIPKANNFSQLNDIRSRIDRLSQGKYENLSGLRNSRYEEIETRKKEISESLIEAKAEIKEEKLERRREEGLTISKEFIRLRGYRTASSFASEYDLTQEEAESRLEEIGFGVEDNRIIKNV